MGIREDCERIYPPVSRRVKHGGGGEQGSGKVRREIVLNMYEGPGKEFKNN